MFILLFFFYLFENNFIANYSGTHQIMPLWRHFFKSYQGVVKNKICDTKDWWGAGVDWEINEV